MFLIDENGYVGEAGEAAVLDQRVDQRLLALTQPEMVTLKILPRTLMNRVKRFRQIFRFREDIRENYLSRTINFCCLLLILKEQQPGEQIFCAYSYTIVQ